MTLQALLAAIAMSTLALSGCIGGSDAPIEDDNTVEGTVDEDFNLQAGKGAIKGLLVDDRFRPVHLVEGDPTTEFQAPGFILLQETAQEVRTSENGEFSIVNLEPGTYTLRLDAVGHEAIPKKVTVQEGLFAETQIVTQRVSSQGSQVVTEEYSGFVTCAIVVPVVTVTFNCNDGSGESYRTGARSDFTSFGTNISYMVVESLLKGEPDGEWQLTVRENDGSSTGGRNYANRFYGLTGDNVEDKYVKVILLRVNYTADEDGNIEHFNSTTYGAPYNTNSWGNEAPINSISFYQGTIPGIPVTIPGGGDAAGDACQDNGVPLNCNTIRNGTSLTTFGTGAAFAQRTQFIISLFLGEPEVDLETYRLLTADSS